jgi:purine-nucleoside phosphorylase
MRSENQACSALKSLTHEFPTMVVMLGSGWNKALSLAKVEIEVSYQDIFGVESGVPGHEGKLVIAELSNKRVAFMAGRFHLYEGYSASEVTLPIQVFAKMGAKKLVVTSASGGLNPKYGVGELVVLSDLLTTFLPDNPLVGPEFVDMSQVFDEEWRQQAIQAGRAAELIAHEGVYAYMHGPHFETFADKMALRQLGADCVGMSTVPEVIRAKALGMKVLGLSLVTNLAFVSHKHEEVLAAAEAASGKLARMIQGIVS